ncbi:unnamed protein product [Calypogeia fissa]
MTKVVQSEESHQPEQPPAESRLVDYGEAYIVNGRGAKMFTCQWLPAGREPRGLIFMCHGYGMECSIFMGETGERLARAGFAVFGIDYEGHGKSDGRRCYIGKFSDIITDVSAHFSSVQDRKEFKGKDCFLYGESMGGAVALLLNRKDPSRYKGMVLVAPMAKIAEKMRPSPFMIAALSKLNQIFPSWKVVPTGDVFELAFRLPEKRRKIKSNKLLYKGKPRIRTALELYETSLDLEERLDEVTLPYLLLHGEDDTVTDPEVSKALFNQSKSFDKTFKLYKGLWHGLTTGEKDEDIDMVFGDIIQWLSERTGTEGSSSSSPMRQSEFSVMSKASDTQEDESKLKGQHDLPVQQVEVQT